MSIFDSDVEISYDDYRKYIKRHAVSYVPSNLSPRELKNVALTLEKTVNSKIAERAYDEAYFYALRCLFTVLDKDIVGVDLMKEFPELKSTMKFLISCVEKLQNGPLINKYNSMIASVKAKEPERRRIVKMQKEKDNVAEYVRRQQEIQRNALNRASELQSLLNGTSGEGPFNETPVNFNQNVPPPLYGNGGEIPPPLYANSPPAFEGQLQQVPSVNEVKISSPLYTVPSYKKWRFPSRIPSRNCARRGLVNLGNTCYMNSVTQMLNSTAIGDYLSTNDYVDKAQKDNGKYFKVINAFAFVIRELRQNNFNFPVSTSFLKGSIASVYEPFDNYSQQDANEFLQVLLESLHSALNENFAVKAVSKDIDNSNKSDDVIAAEYLRQYKRMNSSLITELCCFQEKSTINCPVCGNCSKSFNIARSIEVPLRKTKGMCYLEDCLNIYCREEVLDNKSLYTCPGCSKKVNAKKRLQFFTAPQLLFITLKRFRSNGDFSSAAKINEEVLFNERLDLTPFMVTGEKPAQYSLVGIVNHQGNIHGGHYTSDCKGLDGAWMHFSDEVVSSVEAPDFRLAYILCYARV